MVVVKCFGWVADGWFVDVKRSNGCCQWRLQAVCLKGSTNVMPIAAQCVWFAVGLCGAEGNCYSYQ